MSNLSMVLRSKGNYDDAEHYAVQALEQKQAIYGNDHPRVTTALSNRATILIDMALYKEAAEQYRKILENNRRQLGPDHIYVDIQRQALPTPHTNTIWTLISLGRVLIAQNQTEEAELFLCETVEASVDALPPVIGGKLLQN